MIGELWVLGANLLVSIVTGCSVLIAGVMGAIYHV